MIETVEKAWGTRERLLENDLVTVDRLVILSGGFCSKHYHTHKYNLFRGEVGTLDIYTQPSPSNLNKVRQYLRPGDTAVIWPEHTHYFQNNTDEEVVCYEICYMDGISDKDINRFSESGIKNDVP